MTPGSFFYKKEIIKLKSVSAVFTDKVELHIFELFG